MFPAVASAVVHIPAGDYGPTINNIGPVRIGGEPIEIPSRIYFAEPDWFAMKNMSRQQELILSALYTRHHDGYVREKYGYYRSRFPRLEDYPAFRVAKYLENAVLIKSV